MEEVRTREEEYDFVKDVAMHVLSPEGAAQLASRERRLLYQGTLHHVSPITTRSKLESGARSTSAMPTVQINGLPVHDSADEKQGRAERGRRLASAIHDWHVRRARPGSVSSSVSSSLSLWSHDSLASNMTPNTPMSDVHTSMPDSSAPETIQAFVFTDVVLFIVPTHPEKGHRSEWRLLDDVGLSRILDIRTNQANESECYSSIEIDNPFTPLRSVGSNDSSRLDPFGRARDLTLAKFARWDGHRATATAAYAGR